MLLPILFCLNVVYSSAQGVYDTTYYRANSKDSFSPDDKIVSKEFADYYRAPGIKIDATRYVIRFYLADGTLYASETFTGIDEKAPPLQQFSRAKRDGLQQFYFPSGQIMEESFLSNGEHVGKYKAYFTNGATERIVEFLDNRRYFDIIHFDSLGHKTSEGRFLRTSAKPEIYVKNGTWKYYFPYSDRLSVVITYSKDVENGLYISYDSTTQLVAEKGMKKNGLSEGEWQFFYHNSNDLICKTTYSKDVKHGPFTAYYPSGRKLETGRYKDSLREGVFKTYYPNGNLLRETDYHLGQGKAVFYDTSGMQAIGEGTYLDDVEHGPFTVYHTGSNKPMIKFDCVEGRLEGKYQEVNSDGYILCELTYSDNRLNGPYWLYHENSDKVWITGSYSNDTASGEINVYYRNGSVKRHIYLEHGVAVSETCYNLANEIEECEDFVAEAIYEEDLMTYIGKNLVYPEEAKKLKIEGKAIVRFEVDEEGHVTNVRLIKGFNAECDKEALRLVKNMNRWVPARVEDKYIRSYKTIPVVFWLP